MTTIHDLPLPDLETSVTDLFLMTDGRIRCFGLSREVLELLCQSGLADEALQEQWRAVQYACPDEDARANAGHSRALNQTPRPVVDL